MTLKRLRRNGVILLSLYLLFCGAIFFGGCADRLILFPSRDPLPTAGLQRELIGKGDQAIEIWKLGPRNAIPPQGYVLTFNGNGDRAERALIRFEWQWIDLPVQVCAVNFPGYGGSGGSAHLDEISPQALAAFDHLKAQAGDKPILIDGNSIGTTAALSLAARRPVDGVILTHPPALKQLILGEHGWWNLWLIAGPVAMSVPSDLDSIQNASQCTAPALILISPGDTVVPFKYQQQVANAYGGAKVIRQIPGNHNDTMPASDQRQVRQDILAIFQAAQKAKSAASGGPNH